MRDTRPFSSSESNKVSHQFHHLVENSAAKSDVQQMEKMLNWTSLHAACLHAFCCVFVYSIKVGLIITKGLFLTFFSD